MKRLSSVCAAGLLSASVSVNTVASCDSSIRNTNILATGVLSVVNSWVNKGRSYTLRDAARSFVYGGVGGYGFYKSKQMAGRGDVASGVALAYLSSSVVENVVNDEHPLSYIRYGVGPAELRVSTPLAKNAKAFATLEVDPVEAVQVLISAGNVAEWNVKDGILYGVSKENLESEDLPVVYAQAMGRHVVFDKDHVFYDTTWQHEAVHVIQNIQYQSFFGVRYSEAKKSLGFSKTGDFGDDSSLQQGGLNWLDTDMRFGWFHLPVALLSDAGDYEQRWDEYEAANIGDDRAPYGTDEESETCAAGLSFSFNF
jgi:hypothetical protein